MGRLRLQSKIKSIEDCEITSSNRAGLASMINDEIGDVLAVMRRNVRRGDDQLEHYLIRSLRTLRKQIFSWHTLNPVLYLQPFLDVIRSEEMGAPVTSAALSSVYNILTSDALDLSSISIEDATHLLVDSVTSCRFGITDPASEEVVLMKVLQILLTCMKGKISVALSNRHVCTIVNTCFRIVLQSGTKGELLQRVAQRTTHELIRCVFAHLPNVGKTEPILVEVGNSVKNEVFVFDTDYSFSNDESSGAFASAASVFSFSGVTSDSLANSDDNLHLMSEPDAVPCMVEIFKFLCSLLNVVEHESKGPRANSIAFDEGVPLFTLDLISSAIELGGPDIRHHPRLLSLVQDELFRSLMEVSLSTSPLVLSKVCSIVFNLYLHLRMELKLQLEAFFSCVISRLSQSRHGASYEQQEAMMEVFVSFCRLKTFMVEMYANFDCDMTCTDVFHKLVNLLSKSAFPMNSGPLSDMHILALDGLVGVVQSMAERLGNGSCSSESGSVIVQESTPFWMLRCEDYNDPDHWVSFVQRQKCIKRSLMIGADHFNRDPKKGLEFLQGVHLLPEKLTPQSVACFFKYASGLNKNLVGEFLGNHDDFCVQVLHEFVRTFDFQDMNLDTALRLFLETFLLPGESQKVLRVLEAFSERYYEQSSRILANKDAALVLSYSIVMLNTDHHNVQVKNKMSEEDFIRNNGNINDGNDLPREFLSEIYVSICKNEILAAQSAPGFAEMTPSRWTDVINRSKKTKTTQYIMSDSRPYIDRDMFSTISGQTVAAISAVFDHAEHEEVCRTCIDGFLAVAEISACRDLEDILNDLVVILCKSTTLLNPSADTFGDDAKAQMAAVAIFNIANRYGDFICNGWRYILDCILSLHKLGLLPASDAADELGQEKLLTDSTGTLRRSRFNVLQTIQDCHIDMLFTGSEFLRAESLLQLARALIRAAGRYSTPEEVESAVFCLELLVTVMLNNRDRIGLLWQGVYDHLLSIVQDSVVPCAMVENTVVPCAMVENTVLELLRICQRLLPYKENLADELLISVHMVRKPSPSHN